MSLQVSSADILCFKNECWCITAASETKPALELLIRLPQKKKTHGEKAKAWRALARQPRFFQQLKNQQMMLVFFFPSQKLSIHFCKEILFLITAASQGGVDVYLLPV